MRLRLREPRFSLILVQYALAVIGTILLLGAAVGPVQAQEWTRGRWHTVQPERIGEVQMRALALRVASGTVEAWRVDLHVPPRLGRFLARETGHLDLLINEARPVAPSIKVVVGPDGAPDTVQVSLSVVPIRSLAATDSARFVAGNIQIGVLRALRADLRRMLEQAPASENSPPQLPAPGNATEGRLSGKIYSSVDEAPRLIGGNTQLKAALQRVSAVKEQNIEGRVIIEFVVDKTGRVHTPTVLRGREPLSSAVVRASQQLWFAPGRQDGEPVNVKMRIPLAVVWGE